MYTHKYIASDIVVAGGGMSGVCAAIAAARAGARTVLVQNRPVLGGNASSEIRVWMTGAVGESTHSSVRYSQEMGILGEMQLENLYKNPEGNPYIWDAIVLDTVKREKNIRLLLNAEVFDVEMEDSRIRRISAVQAGTEICWVLEASQFIDCTGDGTVGFLAGADHTHGREAKSAYGEAHAEDAPDDLTLGSTLLFYSRRTDAPVKYYAPDFAFSRNEIKTLFQRTGKRISAEMSGTELWWLEYGGVCDTIGDNEEIKDRLQQLLYGVWDYIKNSGEFDADCLTLEWVGAIPGKRESRRLLGPKVLSEGDIERFILWDDGVCYGGSPIDPHPPQGIYALEPSNRNFLLEGVYQIPLRCLYSRNIPNLFVAGRALSASHVAFCSIRVMKTCGLTGQAAGEAAAFAVQHHKDPGVLDGTDIEIIRQNLLREDCWIPGVLNCDTADLARTASVESKGYRRTEIKGCKAERPIDEDVWFFTPPVTQKGEIRIPFTTRNDGMLFVDICDTPNGWNYRTPRTLRTERYAYTAGMNTLHVPVEPSGDGLNCIHFRPNVDVSLLQADEDLTGFFAVSGEITGHRLFSICFSSDAFVGLYGPEKVINGYARPWGDPSLWISVPLMDGGDELKLTLLDNADVDRVVLYLNPDLMRGLIHIQSPDLIGMGWDKMPPCLLRDFDVFVEDERGERMVVQRVRQNWRRVVTIDVKKPCVRRVIITPIATWGGASAEIFEVRIYVGKDEGKDA